MNINKKYVLVNILFLILRVTVQDAVAGRPTLSRINEFR